MDGGVTSAPAIVDGQILFGGSYDGSVVFAFDATSGAELWELKLMNTVHQSGNHRSLSEAQCT